MRFSSSATILNRPCMALSVAVEVGGLAAHELGIGTGPLHEPLVGGRYPGLFRGLPDDGQETLLDLGLAGLAEILGRSVVRPVQNAAGILHVIFARLSPMMAAASGTAFSAAWFRLVTNSLPTLSCFKEGLHNLLRVRIAALRGARSLA